MDLFEVDIDHFGTLSQFNQHLTQDLAHTFHDELYLVAGLSQYSSEEFFDILEFNGYSISSLGEIKKISKSYSSDDEEITAQFYVHYDEERGIVLFYTDQRKTEEIENTIQKFLERERGVYYLAIGPTLFRTIRNHINSNTAYSEITEFVADRAENSDFPARIRPNYKRTISYYGDDGYQTLEEMESNYGVIPRYIQFKIPNEAKFKITRDGVFALISGRLSTLFNFVEFSIREALEVKHAIDNSGFRMLSATDRLQVPSAEPHVIDLPGHIAFQDVDKIRAEMDSSDFFWVDSFQQEGSLYLNTKVFDEQKDNVFRIKASEDQIRVFPLEEDRNLGSFLRFHEFVQNHIDPSAEVVLPG